MNKNSLKISLKFAAFSLFFCNFGILWESVRKSSALLENKRAWKNFESEKIQDKILFRDFILFTEYSIKQESYKRSDEK